jgi:hypothetical protein
MNRQIDGEECCSSISFFCFQIMNNSQHHLSGAIAIKKLPRNLQIGRIS